MERGKRVKYKGGKMKWCVHKTKTTCLLTPEEGVILQCSNLCPLNPDYPEEDGKYEADWDEERGKYR